MMKLKMKSDEVMSEGYVFLQNVRFYAFHGVMPLERKVGGEFLVDLRVGFPFERALESDNVADTLNYAELYSLVKAEMAIPSKLLEHVAGRISHKIQECFPNVSSIYLKITKRNPPMGSDCDGAGIEVVIEH